VRLRDVATELLAGDVVRPLGLLGRQDARDGCGIRLGGFKPAETERRDSEAAEPDQRVATGHRLLKHRESLPW